jgi:hypothetical protein
MAPLSRKTKGHKNYTAHEQIARANVVSCGANMNLHGVCEDDMPPVIAKQKDPWDEKEWRIMVAGYYQ